MSSLCESLSVFNTEMDGGRSFRPLNTRLAFTVGFEKCIYFLNHFPVTLVSGRFINPEPGWGSDFLVNNQLKIAGIRPTRIPSKSSVLAYATNINPDSSLVKVYVSTKIGHSLSTHSGPSRKPNIASMGKRKNEDIQFGYLSSTWPPKQSQGEARILIEIAY